MKTSGHLFRAVFFSLSLFFLLCLSPFTARAATIYVDSQATGAASGASWAEAYPDLQAALTAAQTGDEIWVAAGIYLPGAARTASFELKSGVGLYGGFAGNETLRAERNWTANPTVLSGDLDGDDNGFAGNNENAYQVVIGSDNAVLDGFTITGGNANGSGDTFLGGGMFNLSASPTVANCIFSYNSAHLAGGGMYNENLSIPEIINCVFSNNRAEGDPYYYGVGGGMANFNSAYPVITNCTFINNTAEYGGGIDNDLNCAPMVTNTILWGNTSTESGNQVDINENSSPTFSFCDVQDSGGSGPGWNTALGTDSGNSGNNIDSPPLFKAGAADYHLGEFSPCVDAGTSTGAPAYDIDGDPRPRLMGYDIGADEFVPAEITGRVTTLITGQSAGISEATVTILESGRTAVSDAAGSYLFDNLFSGTYTLTISKDPFNTVAIEDLVVVEGESTVVPTTQMTLSAIYTQTDLDQAVADTEAAKNAVIDDLNSDIGALNTAIAAMFTQAQLDQAVAEAVTSIETAKDAVIALKDAAIAGLNTEITALNNTVAAKEQAISDLNATVAAMFTQAQLDQAVSEAVTSVETAKDAVIALKDAEIAGLNTEITNLNGTIATKEQAISDLNATVAAMFTQAQLDQAVTEAVTSVETAKDAVIALKDAEIAGLNTEITNLNGTIATKEQAISTLNAAIATREQTITDLNATITTMLTEEELDLVVAEALAAKDVLIAQMNGEMAVMNNTIEGLNVAAAAREQAIDDLNATITAMFTQTEIDQAVTAAEAAKDEIIALKVAEIAGLNSSISDLNAIITDLDQTVSALNSTIAAMFSQAELDQAVWAEKQKWDSNNDGKIGVEELIRTLQIISGIRQQQQ